MEDLYAHKKKIGIGMTHKHYDEHMRTIDRQRHVHLSVNRRIGSTRKLQGKRMFKATLENIRF